MYYDDCFLFFFWPSMCFLLFFMVCVCLKMFCMSSYCDVLYIRHYFQRTSCYNQLQKWWDTPTEKRPFLLQIAPGHRSVKYNTDLPPPSSLLFKVVPPSFEYGLVLLATLIRGGGGITSTRSWTGHLCQNTVQCLKYFCKWLSHLRFTSTSDLHVLNSQNEDYSDINK